MKKKVENKTEYYGSAEDEFSGEVYGGAQENEITVEAEVTGIEKAMDFVSEKIGDLPFTFRDRSRIEIAVDEILSNIVNYAYEGGKGTANLKIESDENGVVLTVTDSGTAYNPLEKEDPDITLSADERGIGGYGIFIVKKTMDKVDYERKDGLNILKLYKNFSA
ncbi:MAG: ATP-binding protein [Clostridia bacterium]|nr:ATP-binding protein [Clostridia bacterium]